MLSRTRDRPIERWHNPALRRRGPLGFYPSRAPHDPVDDLRVGGSLGCACTAAPPDPAGLDLGLSDLWLTA